MKRRILTALTIASLALLTIGGCKKKTTTSTTVKTTSKTNTTVKTTTEKVTTEEQILVEHFERKNANEEAIGNIEYWFVPKTNKYYKDSALTQEITLADTYIYEYRINKNIYGIHNNGHIYLKFKTGDSAYYFTLSKVEPTRYDDGYVIVSYYDYNESLNQFDQIHNINALTLNNYGNGPSIYSYSSDSGKFIVREDLLGPSIEENINANFGTLEKSDLDNYTKSISYCLFNYIGEIDPGYTNGEYVTYNAAIGTQGYTYVVDLTGGYINFKLVATEPMPSYTYIKKSIAVIAQSEDINKVIFEIKSVTSGAFRVGDLIDIVKKNGEIVTETISEIESEQGNYISEGNTGKIILYTNKIKGGDINEDALICSGGYMALNNEAIGGLYAWSTSELYNNVVVDVTFPDCYTKYKAVLTFEGTPLYSNESRSNVKLRLLDCPIHIYKGCRLSIHKIDAYTQIGEYLIEAVNNTTITILGNGETAEVKFIDTTITDALLPTQESYEGATKTLLGFSKTATGEVEFEPGSSITSIEANTTLYAIWSE